MTLSERRQKGTRSLEVIQDGRVPLDVTKLEHFLRCHTLIFSRLPYEIGGKQFGCAGTSDDWADSDGKMERFDGQSK